MSDHRQTPKPRRPTRPESRDPRRPPRPKPGEPRRPLGAGPRPRDPDFFRDTGARFAELTNRMIEVLNSSGGFGAEGDNAPVRPVLRAAADNFAAAASGMSEITRNGIERGQLTEEDLDLIAEVETWAAHFRIVNFTIQRALGDQPPEPGEALEDEPEDAPRDEPGEPAR